MKGESYGWNRQGCPYLQLTSTMPFNLKNLKGMEI